MNALQKGNSIVMLYCSAFLQESKKALFPFKNTVISNRNSFIMLFSLIIILPGGK